MSEESYYDILEVATDATTEVIKKQWKKLARKYHPDKLSREEREKGNGEKIKQINEAYAVISDPEKRNLYDQFGKDGLNGFENGPNTNDIFSDMLFNMFGGMHGMQEMHEMHEMHEMQQSLNTIKEIIDATLEELYTGVIVKKEINRNNLCKECDGTGAKDKNDYQCDSCGGQGITLQTVQVGPGVHMQNQLVCQKCNGTGKYINIDHQCDSCVGKGTIEEKYNVSVIIEKGMCDEDVIVIENEGNEIDKNTRGNIVFIINEVAHKVYKKNFSINNNINPLNLLVQLNIPLHDALTGLTMQLKYLDNNDIYITYNDIICDHDIKIIKGYGMPDRHNNNQHGDLIIQFNVEYPKTIKQENKKKIYELLSNKKYNSKLHKVPHNATKLKLK